MITKIEINEFLDACIGSGKYIQTSFELTHEQIIEVEDILNRFNDKTARTKIRKILNPLMT